MSQHYRFVVSSAHEAVQILRERLGPQARVVSVRQIQGEGLARFLSAPKLEVVAAVGTEEVAPKSVTPPELEPEEEIRPPAGDQLTRVLQRGGITDLVQAHLRSDPQWESLTGIPLQQALQKVSSLLMRYASARPRRELGSSVAFIGTAGTGKTTALCKQLAMEVFFKQRGAVVLKLDMERANPGDGLAVFCDVLGVPLIRSPEALPEMAPQERLFVDCPGFTAGDRREVTQMAELLERLGIQDRVLVLNAAYEASLLKKASRAAVPLGASHVVFTHIDELVHWGKLWEFLFDPERTPLFLSTGPNIAGDVITEILDTLMERSFPMVGKENAMHTSP